MRNLILFLSFALFTACASRPYPVTSPYYQIPKGSRLILKQPLTIAPNKGRVYIQYGKVVNSMRPDNYYPHCWFLSWTIAPTETIIHPDQFVVTASMKNESYVSQQTPLMFASSGLSDRLGMAASVTAIEYLTQLTIHSDKQPDIRQFVCNHWEDPLDAKHLTVAEINQALGDIAELKPLGK